MADRPTAKREDTHHENMKHEEAYQPLWDTDQSVPEYMTLLMGEQTQKNEDAELYEDSEEEEYEELEHPDPDYEYVYPGAPKRYDSARKDSEDEELEYEDAEYEDVEYEDVEYEDDEYEDIEPEEYESEPSDDADDNEEDTENSQDNRLVALASTQPAQAAEPTQPALSACEGTTENTGSIMTDRAQMQNSPEPKPSTVDTSLPVATEPIYGIPDPNLQPMQLLGALSSDAGPTQLASVRWWNKSGAAVAPWDAPGEETETARIIGYIPTSTPEATVDWAKARRGYMPWVIFVVAMQVINPFLLLPLVNIVSMDAALQLLVLYLALAVQTTLLAPLIWLILMIYSLVKLSQKRQEAVARATTYGAFWYHPVYDRTLQEGAHPDEAGEPEGLSAPAE